MGSYMSGKVRETEEEKAERERRNLDRRATQSIKEKLLERQKTKFQNLETGLRGTDGQINRIRLEIWTEECEDQAARQRKEQKKQAEADEKRRTEQEKSRREYEVRMAEERRRCAAEAEERRQQAVAEGKRRRQQAQADQEKAKRKIEEILRETRTRRQSATSRSTFTMASCEYGDFWN